MKDFYVYACLVFFVCVLLIKMALRRTTLDGRSEERRRVHGCRCPPRVRPLSPHPQLRL
jgi:hypothetical protein